MKHKLLSFFTLLCVTALCHAQAGTIRPLDRWMDTDGNQINVHGGGIMLHEGTYYWYGEYRDTTTRRRTPGSGASSNNPAAPATLRQVPMPTGVGCYSSKDLINWKFENVILARVSDPGSDITYGSTIERPKVIYNPKTKKFVLWFHLELRGRGYEAARAAIATSDTPTGNFDYKGSFRMNAGKYPMDWDQERIAEVNKFTPEDIAQEWWTPQWHALLDKGLLFKKDFAEGQMSRDMTLFIDTDGKAYHITAAEENLTLNIHELNDEFTAPTGKFIRLTPGGHNEAPAIFIHKGTYWMITSGCTGWTPNEARMLSAPSIWGPWTLHPNPCKGPGVLTDDTSILPEPRHGTAAFTFSGQSTFVLPVPQYGESAFIFMADQWRPRALWDSRHLWLPIKFAADGTPEIYFQSEWSFSDFAK